MKGIMVPLLVVWMTGIVIGQQQELSNQFRSDSLNASSQYTNQDGFQTAAQPQSGSKSQLAPFELEVSQNDILGIKYDKEGFLQSRIEPLDPKTGKPLPRSVINGISLIFSGKNSSTLPSVKFSSAPQNHFIQGKNILAFGITDVDIANLQTRKLDYDFEFTERGKYDEVVIFYVPPSAAHSNSGPTPDNAANASVVMGAQNNNASRIPSIPLPSPEYEPGEPNFMGPVHPSQLMQPAFGGLGSGIALRDTPSSTWAPPTDRTLTNPKFSNPLPGNQFGQSSPDSLILNQPATYQPTFVEQVAHRKAQLEQDSRLQDLNQRKAMLDAYEQQLIQKSADVDRQKQEFAQQKYLDALRTSRPGELATDYSKPTGTVIGTNIGTGPVVERPQRMASRDTNQYPVGTGGTASLDHRNNSTMPKPSTGGIKDYTASMSGPNSDQNPGTDENKQNVAKQDKRVEGFVMFMLFCSLGLNVYLAWISRGFYVRYNELADELRETFTATM